jgi:hypothetical protein
MRVYDAPPGVQDIGLPPRWPDVYCVLHSTYDFDHARLTSVKNSASRDTLDAMADTEQVDRWSDLRYAITAISDGGMRRHGTTRCHTIRVSAVRSRCTRGSHAIQRRYEGYARHVHVHGRERCITRYDNILVGGGIGGKRGHEWMTQKTYARIISAGSIA